MKKTLNDGSEKPRRDYEDDFSTSRAMTNADYSSVVIGVVAMVMLTVKSVYDTAQHWIIGILWACLIFFFIELVIRIRRSILTHTPYLLTLQGILDITGVIAVPVALLAGVEPRTAWLLAVVWLLKAIPGVQRLQHLRRVIVQEAGALFSVLVLFLAVLFLGSVIGYFLERDVQPETFGDVPSALWWAVITLTTTGYGDVTPVTPLGRIVAGVIMICGLGVFGLWTGILANGFATEMRRSNFLKAWESVSRVPFLADLGPSAIADVTRVLHPIDLPPRVMIIRKGQHGDCMYFIASGEVEVELQGKKLTLGEGAFFGEMALLGNSLRGANITTKRMSKLLVLDLVDFRLLMARYPELAKTIDIEAERRTKENEKS